MINYSEAKIRKLAIHRIGRKAEVEGIIFSRQETSVEDETLHEILKRYFFSSFKQPEYYGFASPGEDPSLNPMYQMTANLFSHPDSLLEQSIQIAKYLYSKSDHPNIKPGDLLVAYFEDLLIGDELLDAVGIYKAESRSTFLKLDQHGGRFVVDFDEGMPVEKIDKGCLIFNTDQENGYKLCIVDHVNAGSEARFWKTDFLDVAYKSDAYNNTANQIQFTKAFINDRLKPLYEMDKVDEAGILQASSAYFRREDKFEDDGYAESLFPDDEVRNHYQDYKMDYTNERGIELHDAFDISADAVKRNARIFKSVLKLDKNFHVYIHGDRSMIERGIDPDGRKYYKIYYENER